MLAVACAVSSANFRPPPSPLHSRPSRLLVVSAQSKRGPQQATRPASKPDFVELPSPGLVQQTMKRAFVLGGVGLHTAEYAFIRVIPARAGEGRYFVRVPEGTISRSKLVEEFKSREREIMEDAFGGQRDPEGQRLDERARVKIKARKGGGVSVRSYVLHSIFSVFHPT